MVDQDSSNPESENKDPHSGNEEADATRLSAQRKKWLKYLAIAIVVGFVLFLTYRWVAGGYSVSTENAYVNAEVAQITPMVTGSVAQVRVVDTQSVKRGDILVVIDPADTRIALAQAEAELAKAQRKVEQTLATGTALSSRVEARSADMTAMESAVTSAQAELDKTRIDLDRRQALAGSGAVSGEELTTAKTAYAAARAALESARAQLSQAQSNKASARGDLAANFALVKGTTIQNNPEVLAARARRDQAALDLQRTVMRAPFDGVVSRRQVQVGMRVSPGAQLMVIVPIRSAYVDANFKEVELAQVRPGQPVELTSDLYGDDVKFHGRVAGLSGGTGAAFAIIPAQNATGNWIKVVQRVPVRIALDPKELEKHPLRVGLSMEVTIDTRQQ